MVHTWYRRVASIVRTRRGPEGGVPRPRFLQRTFTGDIVAPLEDATMAAEGFCGDPIDGLIRAVRQGVCARIWYAKGSRMHDPSERVVIPIKLMDGVGGLVVRAIQVSPENGLRSFKATHIVRVEASDVPLGPRADKAEQFASGEVEERKESIVAKSVPLAARGLSLSFSPSRAQSAWMEPWFVEYLGLLRGALVDGVLEPEEVLHLLRVQHELELSYEEVCAVHAYLLGQELLSMSIDGVVSDEERTYFDQLFAGLSRLGWPILI